MSASSSGGGAAAASAPQREFFAVRAARWLGAAAQSAAQKAGASIARLAGGPCVKALRADLESRAAGPPDTLAAVVAEWARLLAATDDTPRYEDPDGGPPLTFRAAFLGSQAFEVLLATAGREPPENLARLLNDACWRNFMRGAVVQGGEDLGLRTLELLSHTRHLADCRQSVERAAAALKSDALYEGLRSECAVAGTRAEEIRSSIRTARRAGAGPGTGPPQGASLEELCKSSASAVQLYTTFREGLGKSSRRLRAVLQDRSAQLQSAGEALRRLAAEAEATRSASEARREVLLRQREEACAGPRRALEELERDPARQEMDAQVQALEERRKALQMEMEAVAQELAVKRQEHSAIQQKRQHAVGEHRRQAAAVEGELQELRPARFHGALSARADSLTEGEIVAALAQAADAVAALSAGLLAAVEGSAVRRGAELAAQRAAIEEQAQAALQKHAKLELGRLEAAGATVAESVTVLLDVARRRAELAAMGVAAGHEEAHALGAVPDRRDVRRLQSALVAAKDAWEEAASFWSTQGSEAEAGLLAAASKESTAAILANLEAARGRIAQCLAPLQRADPVLYDMAVLGPCGDADDGGGLCVPSAGSVALPHGWEAHTAPTGRAYYHNLVSQQTQWDIPTQDAAVCAGWRLFPAEDGAWFYHNPYDGTGVWWPELPKYPAEPASLDALRLDAQS